MGATSFQLKTTTGIGNVQRVKDILKKLDKSKHTKKVKSALKNYQVVWMLYETEPGPGVIPVPDDLEPSEVA